jgi:hypothetical protein
MLAHARKPPMLLQQPGQMGPLRLKNRVVMGPMGTNFEPPTVSRPSATISTTPSGRVLEGTPNTVAASPS